MNLNLFRDKKFYLILFWLLFTTVFALWWMRLSMGYVNSLEQLLPEQSQHWAGQKRMVFWEGLAWIILLLIGGFTSLYFLYREKLQAENMKAFFGSFNHDVKTSLASLRLQGESLKEDLEEKGGATPLLDRLISDTMRLQVQLENSLFMSAKDSQKVLVEKKILSQFITSAQMRWPQIKISLKGDARILVDERAFTTLLNNLIQNALTHGGATEFNLEVGGFSSTQVEILFHDNGSGYNGPMEKLGKLFYRPTTRSGTGMGLYISQELLHRMGGFLKLTPTPTSGAGFSGLIHLPGSAL